MKYRTVKFYPHHDVVQLIQVPIIEGPRVKTKNLTALTTRFSRGVFSVFYFVGLGVVWPFQAARNLSTNLDRGRIEPGFRRHSLAVFFLLAASPVFVLNFLVLGTSHISAVQGKVLGAADSGLEDLKTAQQYLQEQNTVDAEQKFAEAVTHFQQSERELQAGVKMAGDLANFMPQKRDADSLLQAAAKLSSAGAQLTAFYRDSSSLKLTAAGLGGAPDSAESLSRMENNLLAARDNVIQANGLLTAVDANILPADKRTEFRDMKRLLAAVPGPFDSAASAFSLLKSILAGDKKILFVFENNNELRAGGGFMGTFGAADLNSGSIKNIHISSIYDLDGQLKETIIPPFPILKLSDRWFLRDTNWFADFPSSAKKITQFYEKEGGQTPDAIVAVTTTLTTGLLKITGPVDLPKYGLTLNADNFVEATQVATSVDYDKVANTPKQMLADFFPVFLDRVGQAAQRKPAEVLLALEQALAGKHLLIYSHSAQQQQQLENFNWAGQIKPADRDFLSIVFSNLGGTKTDLALEKTYQLDSTLDRSAIINNFSLTVNNPLADKEATVNRSFVRVYVPKGAALLSINGSDPVPLPGTALLPGAKTDPDIEAWQGDGHVNGQTGNLITEESGKTVFGFWLITPGGQSKTVSLRYRVPLRLGAVDHYSLLWQKQPGSVKEKINYSLKLGGREVLWKDFAPDHEYLDTLSYEDELDQDIFLGLVIQ